MCATCRLQSQALRNTLDTILMNAARDLRSQADSVERALADRISCMEEVRQKLEIDLRTVSLVPNLRRNTLKNNFD